MTDTINVKVYKSDGWKEVVTAVSAESGTLSIAKGGQHCVYTGTPPKTLIGHRFTGELVSYALAAGESLCVKVDSDTFAIINKD